MERHAMLMERKPQYCQNVYTIQSDLKIRNYSYQNLNGIFSKFLKLT